MPLKRMIGKKMVLSDCPAASEASCESVIELCLRIEMQRPSVQNLVAVSGTWFRGDLDLFISRLPHPP